MFWRRRFRGLLRRTSYNDNINCLSDQLSWSEVLLSFSVCSCLDRLYKYALGVFNMFFLVCHGNLESVKFCRIFPV